MLALNAIVGRAGKEHKSGAELWRLLMYIFDNKTVYNIVNVVEMIENVEKAKTTGDIQAKNSNLQRLYLEYSKGFMESNVEDIVSAGRHLWTMDTVGQAL